MTARRSTLKDIANLVGVSTATVARVIHNNGYVAEDTRRAVEAALADTGYQINALAQGLRRQRTYTIGHLLTDIIPNQFFAAVAAGVEEVASEHRCGVLMIITGRGDLDRERAAVETLIQRRVDGMIFTTAAHADNVDLALKGGIPAVQVERNRGAPTAVVSADNRAGASAAVEHLIALGHRRIAIIAVDPDAMASAPGAAADPNIENERLRGYMDALRHHRLNIDPSLIALTPTYFMGSDYRKNPGYVWMHRFLDYTSPPTAVFATFDLVAGGVLQALYERSLRVPDDISVIGFDDTYAPFFAPPLTTVDNPTVEMGRTAAKLLFRHLDHQEDISQLRIQLPMQLRTRISTAPPAPLPAP